MGRPENQWIFADLRVRALSVLRYCVGVPEEREAEAVAAWVVQGCAEERRLRMLCLERVGAYLRTGAMSTQKVLDLSETLLRFGMHPDFPETAQDPVARQERLAGQRRRTA